MLPLGIAQAPEAPRPPRALVSQSSIKFLPLGIVFFNCGCLDGNFVLLYVCKRFVSMISMIAKSKGVQADIF